MGGRSQGLWMDRQEESGSEDVWKGGVRVRGWTEGRSQGLGWAGGRSQGLRMGKRSQSLRMGERSQGLRMGRREESGS